MSLFTDQAGRTISLTAFPQRIISLVPSQTELLADLGLDKEVAGITKFCVHPDEWFRSKTRIGGTKQLHLDRIHRLQPDLIIANKEETVKEQVEALAQRYPVWTSDVKGLASAFDMMQAIGDMTGKTANAQQIVAQVNDAFAALPVPANPPRAAYLIWQEPMMTAGGDTFIHAMLQAAGFANIFTGRQRYPETSIEELKALHCEVLLLSPEPFPFTEKHKSGFAALLPGVKIILADGEMFSWYGSRLRYAPAYFQKKIKELRMMNDKC